MPAAEDCALVSVHVTVANPISNRATGFVGAPTTTLRPWVLWCILTVRCHIRAGPEWGIHTGVGARVEGAANQVPPHTLDSTRGHPAAGGCSAGQHIPPPHHHHRHEGDYCQRACCQSPACWHASAVVPASRPAAAYRPAATMLLPGGICTLCNGLPVRMHWPFRMVSAKVLMCEDRLSCSGCASRTRAPYCRPGASMPRHAAMMQAMI